MSSESDFDVPQTAFFVNYTKKRFCAPKSGILGNFLLIWWVYASKKAKIVWNALWLFVSAQTRPKYRQTKGIVLKHHIMYGSTFSVKIIFCDFSWICDVFFFNPPPPFFESKLRVLRKFQSAIKFELNVVWRRSVRH